MTRAKTLALIIAIIASAIGGAAVYALTREDTADPNKSVSSPPASHVDHSDAPQGETVTKTGEFHCLVPEGDGPHTMECAFGLRQADGTVYGLGSDDPMLIGAVPTGKQIEVTGTLTESKQSKFKTAGTIKATSIKEL